MCGSGCHKGQLMTKQTVCFSVLVSRQVLSCELSRSSSISEAVISHPGAAQYVRDPAKCP